MKNSCTQAPVALITGSARRIGAEMVKHLHQFGYQVIIHYNHSEEDANHLVDMLNQHRAHSATCIKAALQTISGCQKLIDDTIDWSGRLDVLINNASLFQSTSLEKPSPADWDALFNVNVKAPFYLSQHAYLHLKKHKGCIINISDIHAQKPLKGYSIYCQSKAALDMQTLSLAKEFAPNVRVNAIAPGAIMWPEQQNKLSLTQQEKIIHSTPLKQHGHPQFIAQMCLAVVENQFLTGSIIPIDGGRRIA